MTQHTLQGRSEDEVTWFQRRDTLKAAAAWVAMGGMPMALAQQRSNVVEFVGDIALNGQRMLPQQHIQTGDVIATGPGSRLVFVVGDAAFHVRQNSRITVERGATLNTVSLLRMLTGAVVSVFGRGTRRAIVTPTLTAGIRGTGVYTEIMDDQGGRTYFCNCYGTVDVSAGGGARVVSESSYHQSFWGEPEARNGRFLRPANAINHTDEELEFLARLIGQRTAWQIAGKTGVKDGKGYMDETPGQMHPAMTIPTN
ncbi:MAG: iron dicitrate transport regulator FecR [Hydrogenophaga sp.]|uniref:iron dicitrate transport regulator FecR n=1 Tax=Hydrogenophaga sp. TaxID=1904254 RepID=UPI00276E5E9C|nr:iron dicitrate transport regulator FecR [Hydrogenophaga sp.]MDP2417964.1 iron dicitrate transport regulator FecR [Hydrogenophaga sp.]MDZ4186521.1 iron dicitrate transport regulator FecR [Hydrogenophaga sp.]